MYIVSCEHALNMTTRASIDKQHFLETNTIGIGLCSFFKLIFVPQHSNYFFWFYLHYFACSLQQSRRPPGVTFPMSALLMSILINLEPTGITHTPRCMCEVRTDHYLRDTFISTLCQPLTHLPTYPTATHVGRDTCT